MHVRFGTVNADGLKVFYHSAGDPSAPVVLLLHGGEAPAKYQKWYGAALGSAGPSAPSTYASR
jgi:pimeloyl-ACP methyl ester carboxylesterase